MNMEEIDLAGVARRLHERFSAGLDEDYLDGRTLIRDALVELMECSELEAEELVDTLESREYLRFPRNVDDTHPNASSRWRIGVPAAER
jgi:hypothetical protein